jgi:CHAT domain-containing protein
VLDRAVSSYTPTIRSLAYARAHRPPPRRGTTLIIAVPQAPGAPPLPGVTAEAEALGEMMPAAHRLPQPTRGRVLAALPEHAIAHFACHGYADLVDPGASELVMPDRETRPLTLTDISMLHLNARLAYLSACDTLFVRQNLADEAVHLTGAFHLAGYQHVIGTLWSINDAAATKLAVGVYARLTGNGTTEPDAGLAARALHQATRDLRARFPDHPSLWVTHTHTGS